MSIKKSKTPLIKPRSQGGTFYTFSSALEDIGLNINELKNKVSLSHYVVLDIPPFNFGEMEHYDEANKDYNQGDYKFAESFQNYALNMETVLRNRDAYNFAESLTVSERVFWKYLQAINLIKFEEDPSTGNTTNTKYYVDSSNIVKGFGLINAGSQRTDAYGIYNETFVQIPSSYGKMKVLFKPVSDKNYHILDDDEFCMSSNNTGLLEYLNKDDYKDGVLHTGISAYAQYDSMIGDRGIYTIDNETDELCIEFSLDKLREYYNRETLTYDDMGIECIGIDKNEDTSYKFNAILIYYSIYDSTGKNVLATNLYGILILNSAVPYIDINNTDNVDDSSVYDSSIFNSFTYFTFPELEKRQTTATVSGSSYAFRLNVKTSSVYSGNIVVNDESTAAYEMTVEFNDVLRNLSAAINTLKSNANVIATIASDNKSLKTFASNTIDKVQDLEKDINALKSGKAKNITSNNISTTNFEAKNIIINDSPIQIYKNNKLVGSIDDEFTYNKISSNELESDTITSNNIKTASIHGDEDQIVFINDDKISGKITNNGIFTNSSLYVKNNEGAPQNAILPQDSVEKILKGTKIYIDSNKKYYLTLPSIDTYGISQNLLSSLYEKTDDITDKGFNYYNLTNLFMVLLEGYKILDEKYTQLNNKVNSN